MQPKVLEAFPHLRLQHLSSLAAVHAIARHSPVGQVASLLRRASELDAHHPRPTPALARLAADTAATQRLPPQLLSEACRQAAEVVGLAPRSARRVAVRAAARAAAHRGSSCRGMGRNAHEAVAAEAHGGHAFLELALPAALAAAVRQNASCVREAAAGALHTAAPAWQAHMDQAADLLAAQAAEKAVQEGLLPFQVTERAQAAAAPRHLLANSSADSRE